MKLAEIKLKCRDLQEKKRFWDFMILFWFIIAVFWIWHAIARYDIVFLVLGVLIILLFLFIYFIIYFIQ
jgi:hypothetical protein